MVKIIKTHIYDIIDIDKKEEEINLNDIDIDDQIIDDEDNGLNIIEDYIGEDDEEEDEENIINNNIEFDEDEDNNEKKILEKKTFNYLTKYERCFILGLRIQQIMNNSPILKRFSVFVSFRKIKVIQNVFYQTLSASKHIKGIPMEDC